MSLSMRQIEAFRAVMICGTTKAAADMLHVSQPVVSKLISQMEAKLGYALFERKGNAIVPTQAARMLFHEAKLVQERVDQFRRFAKTLGKSESGSLTIYTSATFSTTLVPQLVAAYHARHPGVSIRVANQSVGDIVQRLLANPDAVGVTVWPVQDPSIDCEILTSRPVKVLLPTGHPLAAAERELTLSDLKDENLILHSNSMPLGDAIRDRLAQLAHDWHVPFTVDNSETAYALVEQGLGVFLCDAFASVRLSARNLVSKDIASGVQTSICLLRSRYQRNHVHVEAFARMLRTQVEEV